MLKGKHNEAYVLDFMQPKQMGKKDAWIIIKIKVGHRDESLIKKIMDKDLAIGLKVCPH